MTIRAGVVGYPVAQSLSPLIHGAWIRAQGLDARYDRFEVAPDGFGDFVRLHAATEAGVNVTIPHKEAALALADEVAPAAAAAGAANLLTFRDGRVRADNTDGVGLLQAFRVQAPGFDVVAGPVLVLGAGGAARGAVAALIAAGAKDVRIVNRTLPRAQAIADLFPGKAAAFAEKYWAGDHSPVAAVINATSLGLNGGEGPPVDWTRVRSDGVVMDMVYKPLRTAFLRHAEASGRRTVDGLEMLIRQAVPSFEAFYGVAPPAEVDVRALALEALGETA